MVRIRVLKALIKKFGNAFTEFLILTNFFTVLTTGAVDQAYGRNIECLVDGQSRTTKEEHMWSCPYQAGQKLFLVFTLPSDIPVSNNPAFLPSITSADFSRSRSI